MHKRFTIPAIVLILVNGSSAQGFLGRLKQEAIDTAKKAANEAANLSAPAADTQKGAGNQVPSNQDAAVEKQRADEGQRKKELERQTAERDADIAKENAEYEKKRAEDEARIKKIKADQEAEQAQLNAKWKEDKAKREADATERERLQKEEFARIDKELKERQARERNEEIKKVLDALRTGDNFKTAEHAKTHLKNRDLWQDGMEARIQEVIAERMAKAAQNKFPMADTFKTPIKVYREFESGMSLEWCTAKLETEGKQIYTSNDNIVLKTDDSEVTLIFKKLTTEKPPVLTACVVDLPSTISYSQVLEKYKRELPNATAKHEETPRKLPAQENYVKDGNTLDMQFSMIQMSDTMETPTQTVTIESKVLVGKAYIVDYNANRKVLVCESFKDGTVKIPAGLDVKQQAAAGVVKDETLPAVQRKAVVVEDTAMARVLKDMQQVEQANEKKKQQQKNAEALTF